MLALGTFFFLISWSVYVKNLYYFDAFHLYSVICVTEVNINLIILYLHCKYIKTLNLIIQIFSFIRRCILQAIALLFLTYKKAIYNPQKMVILLLNLSHSFFSASDTFYFIRIYNENKILTLS